MADLAVARPGAIDSYFCISERNSTVRTELLAGLSTYLSLAYIFVVNPAILSQTGLDTSAVLFATVIASGLSTILMGVWARMPFALAPGLEMNGFFAFVVVGTLGLTWQQGLGLVFWSGVLAVLLTFLPARQRIVEAIPLPLKIAIAFAVGVFVLTIGLRLSNLVLFDDDTGLVRGLGSFTSREAVLLFVGLGICIVLGLKRFRFSGNMLVAIIVAAVVARVMGVSSDDPAELSAKMLSAVGGADLLSIFTGGLQALSAFLVLFLIDFYGSISKFIGLTASTETLQREGEVKNLGPAMYVDGIGTSLGAVVGTTSIITYVESAVGIGAGGRTGLTAVTCGVLMLLSLAFTPLVALVPVVAATGVLVYVGYLLLPVAQLRDRRIAFSPLDMAAAGAMGLVTFATFSLDKTLLLGFAIYVVREALARRFNVWLIGSTVLLAVAVIGRVLLEARA